MKKENRDEVPAFARTDDSLPHKKMRRNLSGWLVLDKPLHMTSAHAVEKVKRILHPMKIGHAGTLDPLASGVLPLALGEATKLVSFGMDKAKTYAFEVTWGAERDSDDMEGVITVTSDKRPTEAEIQAILPQFTGLIQQAPPAYSAIKINGVRAYAMARAGLEPEMQLREVRVDSLSILSHWERSGESQGEGFLLQVSPHPSLLPEGDGTRTMFLCQCGKGTYIRSLARDIGRALGCYGHVSALRRTKVGAFSETGAISLEKLEEIVHKGDLGFIKPPQAMLDDILAINLNAAEAALLLRGQSFPSPLNVADDQLVVCEKEGVLVAIAKNKGGLIKSERVFNL